MMQKNRKRMKYRKKTMKKQLKDTIADDLGWLRREARRGRCRAQGHGGASTCA